MLFSCLLPTAALSGSDYVGFNKLIESEKSDRVFITEKPINKFL